MPPGGARRSRRLLLLLSVSLSGACDGAAATPVPADASDGERDGGAVPASSGTDTSAAGDGGVEPHLSIQVFDATTNPMCLMEAPLDTDPAPGLQPDCWATQRFPTSPNTFTEVTMTACEAPLASSPCWGIVSDLACPGPGLKLEVHRGSAGPAPGSRVAIYCKSL